MYLNNKSHRITLRLNDRQFSYLNEYSKLFGVNLSSFLRIIIDLSMSYQPKFKS